MLTGYTDRFSARAGESIDVKVSSNLGGFYEADLVRIFSADPNPNGPGMDLRHVEAGFAGSYPAIFKPSRPGSYARIALAPLGLTHDFTVRIRFQPRLIKDEEQTLFFLGSEAGDGVAIGLAGTSVFVRNGDQSARNPLGFDVGGWLELRLGVAADKVEAVTYDVRSGREMLRLKVERGRGKICEVLLLAAAPSHNDSSVLEKFFNGRIEAPALLRGIDLPTVTETSGRRADDRLADWDLAADTDTPLIRDLGSHRVDGVLVNMPARAVRGSQWSGREMCWRHAPEEYAAVHFHEGDLYDCGWETDFTFHIPENLASGVYGIRLRSGNVEDVIPFFVRPAEAASKAKVALLFSTLTYLAYSNYPRTNFGEAYVARRDAWGSQPQHPAEHPEFGRSLYDRHADGSGVMFSSGLRPQLLMRPGFFTYIDERGSGLRHFPADMHLVGWCADKGFEVDVVTDHDLDAEGVAALEDYALVLTVTHPEYHTGRTLDAISNFIERGGSLGYLGGNGFYWRVATSKNYPGAIEMRRAESGVRMWEVETGEAYHAFDGMYGGLWLKNDRPPQKLVGIGMSAQGPFDASHYRRTAASYTESVAWLFEGISDEVIGDFGLSGGGAAGFELDCVDSSLGTARDAIVVATSEGHGAEYNCVPEKVWDPDLHTSVWQQSQIRADICLTPKSAGNFVFSTGSIMFCGSLPVNDYRNNVSTILENVVRRVL